MKKRDFQFFIFLFFCLYLFSSCRSVKQLTLFQKTGTVTDTLSVINQYTSVIQTGDILSILVNSLSNNASTFFNPYAATTRPSGSAVAVIGAEESAGYLVDENGNIELPLIGLIKVGGLTILQAKETIRTSLTKYLKEPTISIRIVNYRITILGEMNRPGIYTIPNERVTFPEVIALGGDFSQYGRRDNILIIRDNNGKKEFGHVNLNTREIYNSPYYYLHSNDLIYVEPTSAKSLQTNSFFKVFSIVAGIITLAIALFTRVF